MADSRTAHWRGVLTAIVTPLDQHGNLALQHFSALLDFQRQAGIDGVIVSGTNGEGTSLSVTERKLALETALAHRDNLIVLAGNGAASITDAIELTRHASEVGADGLLALPPFFYKGISAQGIADYFRRIMDATDLPVLLYNIPQHSAVVITDEVISLLADHPNLAGVKDSSGDWASAEHFIKSYSHLKIFAGHDRLASRSFAIGGESISGGANAFPELLVAVRDGARRGAEEGAAAQERLNAAIDITSRYPFIANNKGVLAHRGLPRFGVRPPLVNLTPTQEESLIQELREAGLI